MKKFWNYHFIVLLVSAWALLSAVGCFHRDGLYQAYTIEKKTTPYFVLVLEGIHDGIYPWSTKQEEDESENLRPGTEAADISGNGNHTENTTEVVSSEIPSPIFSPSVSNRGFVQVDKSYFDDAVFIGDSRTAGLRDYGGLDGAVFYASDGLNVYDLWTAKFCELEGEKVTLEEALSAQSFKKVYFQIGINEMGRGTVDGFIETYTQAVEKMKELQPDAIIFVQGIMRVTKEKSENDKIFNNEGINLRNERIAELADNQTIFYIDMNEAVCDEEGNLDASLTFDNLHLFGSKYGGWVDFLLEHGIL